MPPNSATADPLLALRQSLRALGAARVYVCVSGGPDSTAMLAAAAQLRDRGEFDADLRALHVNHGMHPQAHEWEAQCQEMTQSLDIALTVQSVSLPPGDETEVSARTLRMAAIAEVLAPGDIAFTAHHADDQLETLLMRLVRGTGARGLAGIPPARTLGAGQLVRPWLMCDPAALAALIPAHITPMTDPSNTHLARTRGWLRLQVIPHLKQHAADASVRAAESAQRVRSMLEAETTIIHGDVTTSLVIPAILLNASGDAPGIVARACAHVGIPAPSAQRLVEIERVASQEGSRHQMTWRSRSEDASGWCGIWGGRVWLSPHRPPETTTQSTALRSLTASGRYALPGGHLEIHDDVEGQWVCGSGGREIRETLRAMGVAPWERSSWPLLSVADQPLSVAGTVQSPSSGATYWPFRGDQPAPH